MAAKTVVVNVLAWVFVAVVSAYALLRVVGWLMSTGLVLAVPMLVSYLTTYSVSLSRAPKGRRYDFVQAHAFELGCEALLCAFGAVVIAIFTGGPIAIALFKTSVIPFESPAKYEIVGAAFIIAFVVLFYRTARNRFRTK